MKRIFLAIRIKGDLRKPVTHRDLGREYATKNADTLRTKKTYLINGSGAKDSCFPYFPRARRKPLPLSLTGQGAGSRLPLTAQVTLRFFP